MKKESKKITVRLILAWIFSIVFFFSGAANMLNSIIGGILIIVAGLVIFPPIDKAIRKKWNFHLSTWLKFFILIILLGVGFSLVYNPQSTDGEIGDANTQSIGGEKDIIHKIGETFTVDDVAFKVNGVSTESEIGSYILDEFLGAKANGVFYIVDLTLENKAKESKNIYMEQFKIVDDQSRKFDYDIEAEIYYDEKESISFGEQLQPDLPVSGVKIFDLPTTAKGLKLEITCCGLTTKTAEVDLEV